MQLCTRAQVLQAFHCVDFFETLLRYSDVPSLPTLLTSRAPLGPCGDKLSRGKDGKDGKDRKDRKDLEISIPSELEALHRDLSLSRFLILVNCAQSWRCVKETFPLPLRVRNTFIDVGEDEQLSEQTAQSAPARQGAGSRKLAGSCRSVLSAGMQVEYTSFGEKATNFFVKRGTCSKIFQGSRRSVRFPHSLQEPSRNTAERDSACCYACHSCFTYN